MSTLTYTQLRFKIVEWFGLEETKDHLVPNPLPWKGTPSTRLCCSDSHPMWP